MNRIRYWREFRGLSADALAQIVGCTQPTITRLETGKQQLTEDWMMAIAQALDVDPIELLSPAAAYRLTCDVVPIASQQSDAVTSLFKSRRLQEFRIITDALALSGLSKGKEIIADGSVSFDDLALGDVVAVEVLHDGSSYVLLRLFMPPGLLSTNRNTRNVCFHKDEFQAKLIGRVDR